MGKSSVSVHLKLCNRKKVLINTLQGHVSQLITCTNSVGSRVRE